MTTFAHNGNGKLIKGPDGKLALDCVCCCLLECPGANGYRIAGYVDGMFTATSPCLGDTITACSGESTWDGTFPYQDSAPSCIGWRADSAVNFCADGYVLQGNLTRLGSDDVVSATLQILLTSPSAGTANLWVGAKASICPTMAGIYTRTDGCSSGPSSLEIEAIP